MSISDRVALDVVIPVYNEESVLADAVHELHEALGATFSRPWVITIADNASTDGTPLIAHRLATQLGGVRVLRLADKGRGRALKAAWLTSTADVVAYVDVDLSTDLRALPPLVAPLLSGHSDIAIGTRLARGSRVVRGTKREVISRGYNALLRGTMGVSFSDAQCGFKAMRRDVAERLLPYVEDTGWFFDTELLVIAERAGLRIHEVPVDWVDDEQSSVDVARTAIADLRGMVRVARSIATGRIPLERIYAVLGRRPLAPAPRPSFVAQVVRFLIVGLISTAAYALLYLVLADVLPGQLANLLALLTTAIANTAANRRFTFGIRGRTSAVRHQLNGLIVFAMAWAITSGSLAVLHATSPGASSAEELAVLTVANLLATVLRFTLFRVWVFRSHREPVAAADLVTLPTEQPTSREALLLRRAAVSA